MQRKIKFSVISSSSHEDHFSAEELMVHAPTVRGWRSSRLCSFPQYILLQLEGRSRVRKLQLLAHQYLIPTKVEFHVGDVGPEDGSSELQLRRLGYVSLSDNEKTGFQARELKSVHVDAVGTFLKVSLYRNHVNRLNHYSQVSLVAINILGESVGAVGWMSREPPNDRPPLQQEAAWEKTLKGACEAMSPLDDLAFDMYQDPKVAHIIRILDQKKKDMVQQENFEQAKTLKQAIADLQKVGERLARYDVEKRRAIEEEEYDLAKKKKELMEELRRNIYRQLEEHDLLDIAVVTPPPPLLGSPGCHGATEPDVSADAFRNEARGDEKMEPPDEHHRREDKPPPTAKPPRTDVLGDERPLLTLQRKDWASGSLQSAALQAEKTPAGRGTSLEPLTEGAQREAGPAVDVYGESLVAEAYSRSWCGREHALLAVHDKLLEASSAAPKEELSHMIRAAGPLARRALLDKVPPVFYASLKLLRLILVQIIPCVGLGRAEAAHCLQQTFPHLLRRTGDRAGRPRAAAVAFIQEIAVLKEVRSLQMIPAELLKPFTSNVPPRLAQSRLELLEKLLAELGAESFAPEAVVRFCRVALEHGAKEVRELAVRIILSLYQQHRGHVLDLLPPRDAATPKNFLYKTLFDGFSRIDGRLMEAQDLKQGGVLPGEEARSLQEQLAVLKEITEWGGEGAPEDPHRPTQEPPKAAKAVSGLTKGDGKRGGANAQQPAEHLDHLCIFCGEKDESFTEDGLDLHYWRHCPMLHRCHECGQVVEISGLSRHLLDECESRSRFRRCPRCCQALPAEDLNRHLQGSSCRSSGEGSCCPLCRCNFLPGEEGGPTNRGPRVQRGPEPGLWADAVGPPSNAEEPRRFHGSPSQNGTGVNQESGGKCDPKAEPPPCS
ncbi:centrosomal protein of 104 kDa isoform X4 [Oryzias latipes]|uniref:centrosomal protein of 104 kDa isoform X4 n=1 Tax=Oryzias latipes TaxID=8090 RepID=UPI000CE1C452|nr:centrosomal protein of 104 kDa isoform X4 [Oryzias latipes]